MNEGKVHGSAGEAHSAAGARVRSFSHGPDQTAGPVPAAVAGEPPIDPELPIGHVHLRTADIDRVRDFYVGVMGFDVVYEARDVPGWGTAGDILFLSAGGYHHHLGFNTWKSKGGAPQPDGVTGLHHVALNFSTRERLADVVRRLVDAGVELRQLATTARIWPCTSPTPTATISSSPGTAPSRSGRGSARTPPSSTSRSRSKT